MSTLPFAELLTGTPERRSAPGAPSSGPSHRMAIVTPFHFFDESVIGGGERWPTNLAHALSRQPAPWDVDILSFGEPSTRELGLGVRLRLLAPHRQGVVEENPLESLSWDLPGALDGADAVLVSQVFTRTGEVACLVAKALGKPTIAIDHGGRSDTVGTSLGLLELVDRVVAHSAFGASLLPPEIMAAVVPGGVDHRYFTPPSVRTERTHLLFVGRLLPHKGVDRLIESLPEDLPLVVCGRPYDLQYFDLLQELAGGKDVRFETSAGDERVRELYRTAWATVLPSVSTDRYGTFYEQPELMGLTVLESMACGTPAVVTDVGGLPEFVDDGRTGFVCTSSVEVGERLELLARDPALVERLGRQAHRTVLDRYTMDGVAGRISGLFDDLLSVAGAGGP